MIDKIIFAIPTARERNKVKLTMEKYLLKLRKIENIFPSIELIVCYNGINDKSDVQISCSSNILITQIEIIEKSKNKAMNAILKYAAGDDIVIFLDDDIEFTVSTLKGMISLLGTNQPYLVGANFKVKTEQLTLFQQVIAHPFNTSVPPFCMGGCMGFRRKYFDEFPMQSNIADDGYICNYFAVKYGVQSIKKSGIAYMEVHKSYLAWKNQQIRITVGVMNSYQLFENEKSFLMELFYWKYNDSFQFRKCFGYTLKDAIYLILKGYVNRKCRGKSDVTWKV